MHTKKHLTPLLLSLAAVSTLVFSGCASPKTNPSPAPVSKVSRKVLDAVDPVKPATAATLVSWPDKVILPGVYRGYLVNGHMVLQRETDPKVVTAPSSSMRFLLGNPEAGEIAYQPLLLEQEHAIELARSRAQNARNEQIFTVLVGKVGELQEASKGVNENTIALAKQLETQTAYIKALEAKLAAAKAEQDAKGKQ